MLFKKNDKSKSQKAPFPGKPAIASGNTTVFDLESRYCDTIAITASELQSGRNSQSAARCQIERFQKESAAVSYVGGATAMGLRTAVLLNTKNSAQLIDGITDAVGKHLPILYHSILHEIGYLHQILDSGALVLFANDVQSLADLSLIGRAAAERALLPCVILNDVHLSRNTQNYLHPEEELIRQFLGVSSDYISPATPAQEMIFGKKRQRVPRYCNLDQPMAVLQNLNPAYAAQNSAADLVFSEQHSEGILRQSMIDFAQLTGRDYSKPQMHASKNARHFVVAQGSVYREMCPVVDYLESDQKIKCGVLHLYSFTPAALQDVAQKLSDCRSVTVIEKSQKFTGNPGPLSRMLQQALPEIHGKTSEIFTALDAGAERKPSFAELAAVVGNMTAAATPRKKYVIGAHFSQPGLRLPKLEMLQQNVEKNYPGASEHVLSADKITHNLVAGEQILLLHNTDFDDKLVALFCAAFSAENGGAFEAGYSYHNDEKALIFTRTLPENKPFTGRKVVVAESTIQLETALPQFNLAQGGSLLLLQSDKEIQASEKLAEYLQQNAITIYTIREKTQARALAILGAIARFFPFADKKQNSKLKKQFLSAMKKSEFKSLSDDFIFGYESVKSVKIRKNKVESISKVDEIDAPWTVKSLQKMDGSLFDLEKFWSRIGYQQADGDWDKISADPFSAMKTMPAGSSAFASTATEIKQIVQFIPENLPGNDLGFLHAFDAGVWGTVQELGAILDTAINLRQSSGFTFSQLPRMRDNLAKLAYNAFQKELVENFCFAGDLFDGAFAKLIDKMQPKEDQKQQMQAEFDAAISLCRELLLLKNEHFFDAAQAKEKGSGRAVVLTINPGEYRDATHLLSLLPNLAAEEVNATPEIIAKSQQNWLFSQALPVVELDDLHCELNPWHSVLNKNIRAAVLPFSGLPSGDGVQTALRIVTVAIEKSMQKRSLQLKEKIAGLQKKVEEKIQGDLSSASQINDFEAYGHRLNELLESDDKKINAANLAATRLNAEPSAEKIQELVAAREALVVLNQAYATGVSGSGRANAILAIDAQIEVAKFPYNTIKSPWLQVTTAGSTASLQGLFAGMTKQMSDTFLALRNAENLLEKGRQLTTNSLQWADFTEEEKSFCPPVVSVFPDIGCGSEMNDILGLTASAKPFKIVLLNSQPETNNASFLHPVLATLNASFQNNTAVVQGDIADSAYLLEKTNTNFEFAGPALIQISAPKKLAGSHAIALAELARQSRFSPAFSSIPGDSDQILPGLDISANPDFDQMWVTKNWIQINKEGLRKALTEKLTPAHFLSQWPQFKPEFDEIAAASLNENHVLLTEFLELETADRTGRIPYFRMLDSNNALHYFMVSENMVRVCEQAKQLWQLLQKLSQPVPDKTVSSDAKNVTDSFTGVEKQELEKRIAELEQNSDRVMQEKLKGQLLNLSGFAAGSDNFQETLRTFLAGISETKDQE